MKRNKILVILAVLCCILLLTLVACKPNDNGTQNPSGSNSNGNTSSGSASTVNEFEEFQHIMSVVLSKFSSSTATATASAILSGDSQTLQTPSHIQDIFADLDSVDSKVDGTLDKINNLALLNLISALTYAQLLNEYGESDKIYGVPMKINMPKSTPNYANAVVLSQGTHKIAYLYSKDDTHGEMLYVYDVNYISDEEFSATNITLNMSQLKVSDSADTTATTYYMYADTNDASLLLSGSWGTSDNGVDANYNKSADSNCYSIDSIPQTIANNCFKKVKSEYESLDFEYIRSINAPCDYEFTWEQYLEVASKLGEKYGIDV